MYYFSLTSSNQLRSFRATVLKHKHTQGHTSNSRSLGTHHHPRAPGSEGAGTIGDLFGLRNLCLTVQDTEDPSVTAVIEFAESELVYPLGLLPGMNIAQLQICEGVVYLIGPLSMLLTKLSFVIVLPVAVATFGIIAEDICSNGYIMLTSVKRALKTHMITLTAL
jgi:hypothetical protein